MTDTLSPPPSIAHRRSSLLNLINTDDVDRPPASSPSSPSSPPSTPHPHHHRQQHTTNGVEHSSIAIPVLLNTHNDDNAHHLPSSSVPPPPSPPHPTTSATSSKPVSALGGAPKSRSKTKPHRSPSPSPPPLPPPPVPLTTVRLEIKLGGPDNYEVDVASMAKATGQRPPTPLPVKRDSSESEGDGDETDQDKDKKSKRKKKKKSAASEYYDITDPFIDDSELAIDERTWFAQTKQQGFYVSSGEVALLKDKTTRKSKKKPPLSLGNDPGPSTSTPSASAPSTATAGTSISTAGPVSTNGTSSKRREGTQDSPIVVDEDGVSVSGAGGAGGKESGISGLGLLSARPGTEGGKEQAGEKRKRYITVVEGGKKRKIVDVNSFHPELQALIDNLKQAIAKEDWSQKGKFPPSLKPLLGQLAVEAIKLDEYDSHFFDMMPSLFPYNKFTMSKLIKRTVFHDHTAILMQRQEQLLEDLKQEALKGFAKAEEEWEKSVQAWDKRQEKAKLEAASASAVTGTVGESGSAAPTRHPTEEMDVDGPSVAHDGDVVMKSDAGGGESISTTAGGPGVSTATTGENKSKVERDQHPPAKKYRMTENMKNVVWQLVLLSNECCRLENEKNSLEGSVMQVSEQGLRKVLYQKIVAAFPEGWMSSGQISRDVSAMKKKLEKEAMDSS